MRPFLAKLAPNYFASPSVVSKASDEKGSDPPTPVPKARRNPFAAVSGVGRWIAQLDDSRITNSTAYVTVDDVELESGLGGGVGPQKPKTVVTRGSLSATDGMYQVEVFADDGK
jgi:hypothetical protein